MADDLNTSGGRNLTAMTLWSWSRVYGAPDRQDRASSAMPTVDRLAEECIESLFDIFGRGRTAEPARRGIPDHEKSGRGRALACAAGQEHARPLAAHASVFLAQGSSDGLVRPQVTLDYYRRLCAAGTRVRMLVMPGVSHGFAGRDSAKNALAWMANRFKGLQAPSDCGG